MDCDTEVAIHRRSHLLISICHERYLTLTSKVNGLSVSVRSNGQLTFRSCTAVSKIKIMTKRNLLLPEIAAEIDFGGLLEFRVRQLQPGIKCGAPDLLRIWYHLYLFDRTLGCKLLAELKTGDPRCICPQYRMDD